MQAVSLNGGDMIYHLPLETIAGYLKEAFNLLQSKLMMTLASEALVL